MIRIGKARLAGALGALLALGVCTTAAAAEQTDHAREGVKSEMKQDKIDKDKVMLKDRVGTAMQQADANIDALKKMSDKDTGWKKARDDNMQKKLSDLRGKLSDDMDKIDKASADDWTKTVKPAIQRDLYAMNNEVRRVAAVTKVPTPRQGATQRQPGAGGATNKQPKQQQQPKPRQLQP